MDSCLATLFETIINKLTKLDELLAADQHHDDEILACQWFRFSNGLDALELGHILDQHPPL